MRRVRSLLAIAIGLGWVSLGACSDPAVTPVPTGSDSAVADTSTSPDDAGEASADTSTSDAGMDAAVDAAPPCATVLGNTITAQFGRLDGVVRRVTVPGDKSCKSTNNHVIIQIDADNTTFTAAINVNSTLAADPVVRFVSIAAPLAGPAWAEGWHASAATIDYGTTLNVHSPADAGPMFVAMDKTTLATKIFDMVKPGAQVSAYMTGFNTAEGGHRMHRNLQTPDVSTDDGALVILGGAQPTWLLFHFSDQSF